jgi:hypothetical protein
MSSPNPDPSKFCGIWLEQNLGPDRTQITKKIEALHAVNSGKGMNVPSTKSLESATKRGRSSGGGRRRALKFKPTPK